MSDNYKIRFESEDEFSKQVDKAVELAKKKCDELAKKSKFTADEIKAYGRQVADAEKAYNQAVAEDFKRSLKQKESEQNSYVNKQIQNINRLAAAQKQAENEVNRLAANRLREASVFQGQSSPVGNFGVTQLKGDVGSAKYLAQLKAMRSELAPTSAEFQKLNAIILQHEKALDKAAGKSALFRDRGLNAARDASLIAMSFRNITTDLQGLVTELRNGEAGFGSIATVSTNTTVSLLAMVPALTAIKKAIPTNEFTKGAQATGLFSIALFDLINKGQTAIDMFKRMTQGGEGFFQALKNAASSNIIGQLTQQILGIGDASEFARMRLIEVADEVANLKNIWDNTEISFQGQDFKKTGEFTKQTLDNIKSKTANDIELKQAKENLETIRQTLTSEKDLLENKKQINAIDNELQRRSPTQRKAGVTKVKEEKSAILELIQAITNEIKVKELLHTLDKSFINLKLAELKLLDNANLSYKERIPLLEKIAELQKQMASTGEGGTIPGGAQTHFGITGLSLEPKLLNEITVLRERFKEVWENDFLKSVKEFSDRFVSTFNQTLGFADAILQKFGLSDSLVANIVREISSLFGLAQQGVGIINTVAGFFSGGAGIGGLSRTGETKYIMNGGSGGMLMANITLPETGFSERRTIRTIVKLTPAINNSLSRKNYAN